MSEHLQRPAREEMTVRELATQLGDDQTRPVKDEITLAKPELFASSRQTVLGGGMLTGALVAGLTSWLALVAAAVVGIAAGLPVWSAALLVGVACGTGAAGLTLLGLRLSRRKPKSKPDCTPPATGPPPTVYPGNVSPPVGARTSPE